MSAGARVADALLEASVVGGHTAVGFGVRRRLEGWGPPVEVDLTGRTFLITGATSGIGRAGATMLARAGATIRSASRSAERAEQAQGELRAETTNPAITIDHVDLSRPDQAAGWAHEIRRDHERIDGLLHVAGAYFDTCTVTEEGIEANAAISVIAPFVLTSVLADRLAAADDARIVTVSSSGAYAARLSIEALEPDPDSYRPLVAYARSKRAQMALTHAWARRFGDAVGVHALTPGWCDTPLVRRGLPRFRAFFGPVLRDPEQGADTLAWLASRPGAEIGTDALWRDRSRRWEHRLPHTLAGDDVEEFWRWCERRSGHVAHIPP
jgi:dehydrogenase/reductase SDR family member 12